MSSRKNLRSFVIDDCLSFCVEKLRGALVISERYRSSNIGQSTRDTERVHLITENESSVERESLLSQDQGRHQVQSVRKSFAQTRSHAEETRHKSNKVKMRKWKNKVNSAINYDCSISYQDDPIISIVTMTVECESCSELKFRIRKN